MIEVESINISTLSWNRFRSRFLHIAPEIVGQSQEFIYDDHLVTISLPSLEKLTSREDFRKLEYYEEAILYYNSWREENGVEKPIAYAVGFIDVTISIKAKVNVPKEILNRPPNAYEMLSDEERKYLNEVANDQRKIAERVFDYWLKIIRWQSDNSMIGRPEVIGFDSGWSTYILDESTRKRIWAGDRVFSVGKEKFVTLQEWDATGELLKNGVQSPIYIDYYYDAIEHLRLADFERCVIDLAVSCEEFMRSFVVNSLRPEQPDSILRYIDQANIHNYIDKFVSDFLDPIKKQSFENLKKDLRDLFTARNTIMHGKKLDSLTSKDCQRFIKSTRSLIELIP